MNFAIFGGSFDPPHIGHIAAVSYVLATTNIHRVFVMPCWEHAAGKKLTDFDTRYRMCELAFNKVFSKSRVIVSDAERKHKTSFTADLIMAIKNDWPFRYTNGELALVVGSDIVRDMPTWGKIELLKKELNDNFIIVPRAGYPVPQAVGTQFDLPNIRSSELRPLIAQGHLEKLVTIPRPVRNYIKKHKLYGAGVRP